ncbi:phosphatase PAP2 family protein [Actinoallomurus sp. NBC_01490]|uniref:phosphatase PAP2 family protein n=1 Tax=Actinoallomurus sp. NBC_01490 TaxID=2903557 RepID=UPI002E341195|nr:phosphatase PAP2 family protein [Actinoallomurus sp. NBC_01490]
MTSPAAASADHLLALNGPSIDGTWYRGMTGFAQRTPWLQPLMTAYTTVGVLLLCALLVLAWWNARRRGDLAAITAVAWAGVGTLVCVAVATALKQVFAEGRPCLAIAHVTTVQPCPGPSDYAFPSNHTALAAALAAGIWLASRRLGLIAAVLALLEGFSRVYLGQHYPHDVLAALALAALITFGGWPLTRRPLAYLIHWFVRTPLRLLLTGTR